MDSANLLAVKLSKYYIVAVDWRTQAEYLNVVYTDVTAADLRYVETHIGLSFGETVDAEFPASPNS